MSKDTFLETLLDGAEVEWVALGEICKPKRGKRLVKKQLQKTGSYAVYQNSMKPLGYYEESNVTAGTLFIVCAGAAGEIGYSIEPFWAADDVYYFESNELLNSKFLYHYLLTQRFKILSRVRRASIPRLSKESFDKIQIPIPCPENPEKSLAIQAKIVRILDTFTELTAELTARKKQYNYYRDQLLTFDLPARQAGGRQEDGEVCLSGRQVEWKTLGEVAEYSKNRISSEDVDESNYVGVANLLQNKEGKTTSNYVPAQGNLTGYKGSDILIGNIRPYLKKIWQADCAGGVNGDVLVIHPTDEDIEPRYLYQILADDGFFEYNMQHAKGAKMPRGNKPKIMEYKIPVPFPNDPEKSLAEQARIVAILDKFDTLTHSISEGLPREIELRQKQYEYYRDLLLNFPKSEPQTEIVA